uniref:Uncharacterized protein n=1 Tax=Steinernema glaseri TaxID=37863 RepID=A0A1I7YV01_9BILA
MLSVTSRPPQHTLHSRKPIVHATSKRAQSTAKTHKIKTRILTRGKGELCPCGDKESFPARSSSSSRSSRRLRGIGSVGDPERLTTKTLRRSGMSTITRARLRRAEELESTPQTRRRRSRIRRIVSPVTHTPPWGRLGGTPRR